MNNNIFSSRNEKRKSNPITELLQWIFTFSVMLIIALFITGNAFAVTVIEGRSMEPSFFEGDRVFNNRLSYHSVEPQPGDVVIINKFLTERGFIKNAIAEGKDILENISYVFNKNKEVEVRNIIKRVIGIPGDTIDIKNRRVYINGEELEEDYIKGTTFENSDFSYPLTIPENKVFVLGDNRDHSLDSRGLGLIDYSQIKGKVVFRLWPIKKIGKVS